MRHNFSATHGAYRKDTLMENLITGFLALAVLAVFLGGLAYAVHAVPVYVIFAIVLVFAAIDFFQFTRHASNRGRL